MSNKILVQRFGLKTLRPHKIRSKKFGQNRSVTAEIFLICTNVARTNIAWMMASVKDGPKILPLTLSDLAFQNYEKA